MKKRKSEEGLILLACYIVKELDKLDVYFLNNPHHYNSIKDLVSVKNLYILKEIFTNKLLSEQVSI